MTKRAFFRRTLNGLAPDDDTARDVLRGVKVGAVVAIEVYRPHNLKMMRLYWFLMSRIADAVGIEAENVSDVVKLRTGHFTAVQTKDGIERFPKSISFAKMDQAAFREFFDRVCQVISCEWLPHMKAGQIRDECYEAMGLNRDAT